MVDQELIERVTRLTVSQRLELIERLSHSLREELAVPMERQASALEPVATEAHEKTTSVLSAVERLAQSLNLDVPLDSSLHRMIGAVPGGAVPMTKEGVRDLITDYLIEKHS
ncbi:MAG: hypothetical protein M3R61_11935 [Chloroflexota bacterium]|nr:hypothetical protein [Chloroflexota bacterium]